MTAVAPDANIATRGEQRGIRWCAFSARPARRREEAAREDLFEARAQHEVLGAAGDRDERRRPRLPVLDDQPRHAHVDDVIGHDGVLGHARLAVADEAERAVRVAELPGPHVHIVVIVALDQQHRHLLANVAAVEHRVRSSTGRPLRALFRRGR